MTHDTVPRMARPVQYRVMPIKDDSTFGPVVEGNPGESYSELADRVRSSGMEPVQSNAQWLADNGRWYQL